MSGRYAVEAAQEAGHEVVVLSRSAGVDLTTGSGLAGALEGVTAVVDAANTRSQSRKKATAFFEAAATHLQEAAAAAGVKRIVVVSIVGIDRLGSFPYYGAKLAHEAAARKGPVPVTVLRATQFHEFPVQVLARAGLGPVAAIPRFQVQTVAARTVGATAAELAAAEDPPDLVNLAGPETGSLPDLARAAVERLGRKTKVVAVPVPGRAGRLMMEGALTVAGVPGARVAGPGFTEWLAGPDIEAVADL